MSSQSSFIAGCRSAGPFDALEFEHKEGLETAYKDCLYKNHAIQVMVSVVQHKLYWSCICFTDHELNYWRET